LGDAGGDFMETEVDDDLAIGNSGAGVVTGITGAGDVGIVLGCDFGNCESHAAAGTIEKNI
jgi:hypothetical protein